MASKDISAGTGEERRLSVIAESTVNYFTVTADDANAQLELDQPLRVDIFSSINTMTDSEAVHALLKISDVHRRNLLHLRREPAIARVVALDDDGNKQTYFVARATPNLTHFGNARVVSYRSPVGRLASLPVGSDHEIPTTGGNRYLEVVERAELHPSLDQQGWDSVDSTLEGAEYGPFTVVSFRALIEAAGEEEEGADLLDRLLAEDRAAGNVIEGLSRRVIAKMELRDRPLLDQYQDKIFRLPLDSRLVILGPPGTGKTTTLTKRLGLKLDAEYLEEEERNSIAGSVAGSEGHDQSWLMFTPTELLKQYVKEAIARENIPASDLRIRTWDHYRRELARNRLGILRTSTGRGAFVLREGIDPLQSSTVESQTAWFTDFDSWQSKFFWTDLAQHAEKLATDSDTAIRNLGARLKTTVESAAGGSRRAEAFVALAGVSAEIQDLIKQLRTNTDGVIRHALAKELQRDRGLLDSLLEFVDRISENGEETDDPDGEEEEDITSQRTGREAAFEAYSRVVRAQARAAASGRNLGRRSRSAKVAEWLGDRSLAPEELREVGISLLVQTSARRFVNPLGRYIGRLPHRYRQFRRERRSQGDWYRRDVIVSSDIAPLEVDVVLLAMLRAAGGLLQDTRIAGEIEDPRYAILKTVRNLYTTQVVVDEATDFSPLQLACMAAVCDPAINSFLACGDYNQRITAWGSRSDDDLKWVFPDIDIRSINITYRHSRQLNEFARRLVLLPAPDAPEAQLPQNVDTEGVDPVLANALAEPDAVVAWLADRIREIEQLTQSLPSIAVLVNNEGEVQPIADALSDVLSDQNIRAIACPRGQVMGQENDVRVFDVQHIKGLEFEAVFFLGIDLLAEQQPDLFDKYLYVGATRAATYLGLTTEGSALPPRIAALKDCFTDRFSGRS